MKVLIISNWYPYPPINGAKIRVYNLVRELSAEHELSLIAFVRNFSREEVERSRSVVDPLFRSVQVVQPRAFAPDTLRARLALFSPLPRSVALTYSREMERRVDQTLAEESFDAVVAIEVGPPSVVSLIASKIRGVPVILDALEVAVVRDEYRSQTALWPRLRTGSTWAKLRRLTAQVVASSSACTVPSIEELDNLREIVGDGAVIEMVPHGVPADLLDLHAEPRPESMVYAGSLTYAPNADAVEFFLGEIHAPIRRAVPGARLTVLGNTGAFDVSRFAADPGVRFAGFVSDVHQAVADAWVSVAPLRTGAGTRLKIIESMALGVPVVSTSKGAEGLAVTHRKDILIADQPEEFAQAVVEVLRNPGLRESLSREGRRLVADRYTSRATARGLDALLRRVVADRA